MAFDDLMQQGPTNAIVQKRNSIYLLGKYSIGLDGVKICTFAGEDDETGERAISKRDPVCSKAIVPTAIYDNSDAMLQKVEVSIWERGRWHKNVIQRSVLTNKNKILQLADLGYPVGSDNANAVSRYFHSILSEFDEKLPRLISKSSMGWYEIENGNSTQRVFMPYTDSIQFDGEDQYGTLYKAIKTEGSKKEYIKFMHSVRTESYNGLPYNLPIRMVMAASFASPMIELVGENPFVLHLYAPTGKGKTVALMVAASIWGDPSNGKMVRSLNMTQNSMMSTSAFLRNLPFCGDELQTLKSRWNNSYDQIVMNLCEGADRGRMQGTQLLGIKPWKNSFIFTGEDPIIKASSGGGAVNRVIQIEAEGKIVQNGNRTANFVKAHYGQLGKEWTEYLANHADELSEQYNEIFTKLMDKYDTTDKQAGAMAILLLADNLATELFWPDEQQLTDSDVFRFLASAADVDQAVRAWKYTVGAIAEYGQNFEEGSKIRYGLKEGRIVWINKNILSRILSDAAYDFDALKKRWVADGHLELNSKGKFSWYKSIYGDTAYYVKLIVPNETESDSDGEWEDKTGEFELPF